MNIVAPPAYPDEESDASPNSAFFQECRAIVSEQAEVLKFVFGHPNYTKSDKWGEVMRVAFKRSATMPDTALSHTLVCWKPAGKSVRVEIYLSTIPKK